MCLNINQKSTERKGKKGGSRERMKDVAKALFYAVEQQFETGQAIPVTGGQTMLN